MRTTSPARRRLALLIALSCAFALLSVGPPPSAQIGPAPRTVARTVPVAPQTLATDARSAIRAEGDTLRALSAARTQPARVCSPIWSTMFAVAWHQTGAVPLSVTAQSDDGDATVVDDTDAMPDRGTPEYHPGLRTSDLYWTEGTRCARFTLRMPAGAVVSDVRVQFLNTSGTGDGPGTGPTQSLASRSLGMFAAPAAGASTGRPFMVSRASWGAMKPRKNCLGYAPYLKMAYVHHTSGSNDYTPAQSDDVVRGIQYFHEHTRGYCDIAYNFLVDKFGTIYVGRYDSDRTRVNIIPGSQMGFNTYTFSISAMGNYQSVQPSAATIQSIERILAWRLDVAHLPPLGTATMTSSGGSTTRYKNGQTVKLPLISGHRQTGITDCPGNLIWNQLGTIRNVVTALGAPKFYRPAESRSTVTPFTTSSRFTAKATDPLQWEVDILDGDGNVVRDLYAHGQSLGVSWDGLDRDGLPAPPGTYTALIQGWTADGRGARPAGLPIAVNPAPEPSPTPSPTA